MATITAASHVDHNLAPEHLALVTEKIAALTGFAILTLDLPDGLPSLPCALHGPLTGSAPVPESEATYAVRGTRAGPSRLVNRPTAPTRKLSVIVGPHEGAVILYTAFGGPVSPREPFEPGLTPEQVAESTAFWSQHALSV